MRYFLDKKITTWERVYLEDSISEEEALEIVNRDPEELTENWSEALHDTIHLMTPEENGGIATLELIKQEDNGRETTLWTNKQ